MEKTFCQLEALLLCEEMLIAVIFIRLSVLL